MAHVDAITVKVSLDIDLDGEPVTHFMEMPASMERMSKTKGLIVHLHLDEHKLAKALLPYIVHEMRHHINGKRH